MKYNYDELLKAVKENETEENINALAEWFEEYGRDYWNGEYYDADGIRLFPVYKEVDDDEFQIVGWEVR